MLPGYMLAGFAKRDGLSVEGAIKYFLLGSFSSAILLFGLAFVFGYTGTTNVAEIGQRLGDIAGGFEPLPVGLGMGLALITAGGGLQDRRGAVPLLDAGRLPGLPHAGHRLPVGRPQGGGVRARAAPVRGGAGPAAERLVGASSAVLAVLTMTLGNLAALGQDNIKRMLAYSSIAHTGYIMVGPRGVRRRADPEVQEAAHPGRPVLPASPMPS